jgi:hypothetical protein
LHLAGRQELGIGLCNVPIAHEVGIPQYPPANFGGMQHGSRSGPAGFLCPWPIGTRDDPALRRRLRAQPCRAAAFRAGHSAWPRAAYTRCIAWNGAGSFVAPPRGIASTCLAGTEPSASHADSADSLDGRLTFCADP